MKKDIVNEWEYENIVDNYRECNHGIQTIKFNTILKEVDDYIKELETRILNASGKIRGLRIIKHPLNFRQNPLAMVYYHFIMFKIKLVHNFEVVG